jgi:hypothetical protein
MQHQQWHVTLLFLRPNSYKNYNLINWSKLNKNNEIWSLSWNENFIFSFRISKKWLLLNFSSRTTRLHCGYWLLWTNKNSETWSFKSLLALSLSLSLWRQIETSDIPYLGHRKNNYLHLIHVEKSRVIINEWRNEPHY